MGQLPPVAAVLVIVLLVVSLGIHEAAHGWVALKCGDTTARDLGRITLNPIPHIDPFFTIILPAMLLISNAGIVFGGAKPVPVNFYNLRRPYRDMALVALAGPAANFLLAILFYFVFRAVLKLELYTQDQLLPVIMSHAVYFNLLLAAFNLLPIPPLDGARVMTWLLPSNLREPYIRLERFGLLLVFGLLYLGVLRGPLVSTLNFLYDAVHFVVSLGGIW
ncbi:MAG: site-2 protease family protein [Planctomycetota bacterium]|nr:site-2 protease family protein [Planctomycetota bacterium]